MEIPPPLGGLSEIARTGVQPEGTYRSGQNVRSFDPVTGRSYEECADEWTAEMAKLTERVNCMRWWHLREQIAVRRQLWIMAVRLGM